MKTEFVLEAGDIDFLKDAFADVEFHLYKATVFEGIEEKDREGKKGGFLSAFACQVESEAHLEQIWSRISNLIGADYQVRLEDEFSSWNIYLVFFIR